ncbi:transcriptional activator of allantoin GABA catabolic [Fusarium heterosporum]|uniref:Transcriptional activator of allantoin GABA catabolic n=1 Tax=Fusarium heterosporum TaxID=42747 RepID=A0A8H5TWF7_FUSHE|nr:transcriptional activator of allantoin GABA catabolic [Fusarium heterosporum]
MISHQPDGHENLNPETLGLSGDMDPYLLQRYQADDHGTFKFKQLAIRSVNNDPPVQFLISQQSLFAQSRREAGHPSISKSELRKDLEKVVPQSMGNRLIHLYMRFVAPHYPIFSSDLPPDPTSSEPGLLAAIYSISFPFAMYDDKLCIDMAYESPDPKDLADLINTAVSSDLHSPTLATVQTLFLVAVRPPPNPLVSDASYRWAVMGMLASTAVNLGLHLNPSLWNIPPAQIYLRRRLSFFIFALDKWLAAALGRAPQINRDNWLVDQLSSQDEHSCGLDAEKWADIINFAALTPCLTSTLSRLYGRPDETNHIASELIEEIDRQKPDTTRSTNPESHESMPSISTQLGHHYIRLLILRAWVHSQVATEPTGSASQPRRELKTLLEEFPNFIKNLKSDETAQHWPPWCQSAFSSMCYAMLFMFVSAPTFDEAFSFIKLLEATRRQMRLKANTFLVLRLGLLRMDAIFWRGIDQVLHLEPHIKLALEATMKDNS